MSRCSPSAIKGPDDSSDEEADDDSDDDDSYDRDVNHELSDRVNNQYEDVKMIVNDSLMSTAQEFTEGIMPPDPQGTPALFYVPGLRTLFEDLYVVAVFTPVLGAESRSKRVAAQTIMNYVSCGQKGCVTPVLCRANASHGLSFETQITDTPPEKKNMLMNNTEVAEGAPNSLNPLNTENDVDPWTVKGHDTFGKLLNFRGLYENNPRDLPSIPLIGAAEFACLSPDARYKLVAYSQTFSILTAKMYKYHETVSLLLDCFNEDPWSWFKSHADTAAECARVMAFPSLELKDRLALFYAELHHATRSVRIAAETGGPVDQANALAALAVVESLAGNSADAELAHFRFWTMALGFQVTAVEVTRPNPRGYVDHIHVSVLARCAFCANTCQIAFGKVVLQNDDDGDDDMVRTGAEFECRCKLPTMLAFMMLTHDQIESAQLPKLTPLTSEEIDDMRATDYPVPESNHYLARFLTSPSAAEGFADPKTRAFFCRDISKEERLWHRTSAITSVRTPFMRNWAHKYVCMLLDAHCDDEGYHRYVPHQWFRKSVLMRVSNGRPVSMKHRGFPKHLTIALGLVTFSPMLLKHLSMNESLRHTPVQNRHLVDIFLGGEVPLFQNNWAVFNFAYWIVFDVYRKQLPLDKANKKGELFRLEDGCLSRGLQLSSAYPQRSRPVRYLDQSIVGTTPSSNNRDVWTSGCTPVCVTVAHLYTRVSLLDRIGDDVCHLVTANPHCPREINGADAYDRVCRRPQLLIGGEFTTPPCTPATPHNSPDDTAVSPYYRGPSEPNDSQEQQPPRASIRNVDMLIC